MRGYFLRVPHTLKQYVLMGFFVALVSICGVFYSTGVVQAAGESCTWSAAALTDIMSDADNWAGCTLTADDSLVFDGTVTNTPATWDALLPQVASITFSTTTVVTVEAGASVTSTGNILIEYGVLNLDSGSVLRVGGTLIATSTGSFVGDYSTGNNTSTVQMYGTIASIVGGTGTTTFSNLTIDGSIIVGGNVTTSKSLTIKLGKTLNAGGYILNFTNTTTPFAVDGTFTESTSTVMYSGTDITNVATSTYYNLKINSTNAILGGNVTSTNALTIHDSKALNAGGYIVNLTAIGTPLVLTGTLTESTSTIMYSGGGKTQITTSTYYNLKVNSPTAILGGNVTSTNVLTITAVGTLNLTGYTAILTGASVPFVVSGTLIESTSTIKYMSAGTVTTTAESYYNLTLGAGTYNLDGDTTSSAAFVNGGTLSIGAARTLAVSGTYNNNGTVTETGAIQHASESADITDSSGTPVADVETSNQIVYVTVEDQDGNLDATALDTITGSTLTASTFSDSETMTLTETGVDTGVFISSLSVARSSLGQSGNGRIELSSNGTFTLAFADNKDAGDTGSDTATYTGSSFSSGGRSHGGGGGGGGSPASPSVVKNQPTVDPSVPVKGSQQSITLSDIVAHEVKVGTTVHHVTKVSATDKVATIIVESSPIKVTLQKNALKKLDTNGDKKLDLSVSYYGFVAGQPKFIFTDLVASKKVTSLPVVLTPVITSSPMTVHVSTPSVSPLVVPVLNPATPLSSQFNKNLSVGMAGTDVRSLQQKLKDLGFFTLQPNGVFGPATKASVIKFQSSKGISPLSGFVGPLTRKSLNSL